MKISREGYTTIFIVNIFVSISVILTFEFGQVWLALLIPMILIELLVIYFFRDPERAITPGDNLIIAPADGKVILVKEVREDKYLKSEAIQISIFLSVFNVHVNRYPLTGVIKYFEYMAGKFLIAFDDRASLQNEQTIVGLEHAKIKIVFKQIVGLLARRLEFYGKENDTVRIGDRCGIMKFGSRMDIIVPKNVEILVKIGDKTIGGQTILGKIV